MKKFSLLCAMLIGFLACGAQTVTDQFIIGPYVVDYNGQGDVKYRLMDNVNLYEFFELKQDTTIVAVVDEEPIRNAVQLSGKVGANRYSSKEFGLEGVWKHRIGKNLYFNGGVSFVIGHSNCPQYYKRTMLEIGLPLQLEVGKLNHQNASLYGLFGVTPTFYSTMSTKIWGNNDWLDGDQKKSGLLVAPSVEFGGNIPLGSTIVRLGVYGTYKINCTTKDFDAYKTEAGRCFLGAKIGIVL